MNPPNNITDRERGIFLRKIAKTELMLSEWEQNFVSSYLASTGSNWFTPGRREAVDRMRRKFGHEPEIGMPYPLEVEPTKPAPADPTGCEYLVRGDGLEWHCNEPAALARASGFRYCQNHADEVRKNLKRRGQVMHLTPFKS
jgi:hypothetical protein